MWCVTVGAPPPLRLQQESSHPQPLPSLPVRTHLITRSEKARRAGRLAPPSPPHMEHAGRLLGCQRQAERRHAAHGLLSLGAQCSLCLWIPPGSGRPPRLSGIKSLPCAKARPEKRVLSGCQTRVHADQASCAAPSRNLSPGGAPPGLPPAAPRTGAWWECTLRRCRCSTRVNCRGCSREGMSTASEARQLLAFPE